MRGLFSFDISFGSSLYPFSSMRMLSIVHMLSRPTSTITHGPKGWSGGGCKVTSPPGSLGSREISGLSIMRASPYRFDVILMEVPAVASSRASLISLRMPHS